MWAASAGDASPIFVRAPSADERARLGAGLRAADAFTVRRAQIVLLSAEGRRPGEIGRSLRCAVQTVRNSLPRTGSYRR
jgi:DNA-binding CsgD family transcriptional regulator